MRRCLVNGQPAPKQWCGCHSCRMERQAQQKTAPVDEETKTKLDGEALMRAIRAAGR